LKNLMIIEREKLYADLKYPSLNKYLVKELGYSDAEATVRVNAVRLMNKSPKAVQKIEEGSLSLTNASAALKASKEIKDEKRVEELIEKASTESTRKFQMTVQAELKQERKEVLVLKEYLLNKFDRVRPKFGEVSNYEILEILLEKELNAPVAKRRGRPCKIRNSRFIPKSVKLQVYSGECAHCGVQKGLEYDHKVKFSHGGNNSAGNIQMLCRSCNQRKEIRARQWVQ
jgi:hypothetical protein